MSVEYCAVHGEIRCFESEPVGPYAQYDAFCNIHKWRSDVACLRGFKGTVSRKIMREIVALLIGQGIRVVYAERDPARRIPFATRVDSGDFAGMWRLDLKAVHAQP